MDGILLWDLNGSYEYLPYVTNRPSVSILVDTNIVSGLARGDLSRDQAQAVVTIVEMMKNSNVTLAGSTVMRDELNKIPVQWRSQHVAVADTFRTLKTSSGVTWLDPNSGAVVESPTYAKLRSLLPDEPDARMIAIGEEHAQSYFMTDDRGSVLRYRTQIESFCSIKLRRPTEILAELQQRST